MDYTKPRGYLTNIRRLILLFRDPSETIKINQIKSEEKIMKTEIIKYQDSILPERGKENCVKLSSLCFRDDILDIDDIFTSSPQ